MTLDATHSAYSLDVDETAAPEAAASPPPPTPAETELQFYARRAQEESRLAKQASSPKAAAAHAYLAAAYSAAIAQELGKQQEFEDLLLRIN